MSETILAVLHQGPLVFSRGYDALNTEMAEFSWSDDEFTEVHDCCDLHEFQSAFVQSITSFYSTDYDHWSTHLTGGRT